MRADDAAALHPVFSDPAAAPYGSHAPFADVTQTRAKLEANLTVADWRMWVPPVASEDRAMGNAGGARQAIRINS